MPTADNIDGRRLLGEGLPSPLVDFTILSTCPLACSLHETTNGHVALPKLKTLSHCGGSAP